MVGEFFQLLEKNMVVEDHLATGPRKINDKKFS